MGNTAEKQSPDVETVSVKNVIESTSVETVDNKKPEEKKKLKACCACPDTKRVRDECILLKGEENCKPQIEAHKKCMRDLGFNI